MNSCVQFSKTQEFSPVDSLSVWEVGDTPDTETVICDVKQEVEADEDLPPWASSDSTVAPEKSFSTLQSKMTVSDILRGVKVREETLQSAVARLGGGTRGLQMLLEHVNHWALKSQDEEDVVVAIRREIVLLGMPPTPQRHRNPEIRTTSGDGNTFDVKGSPRGTCEIVNHGAAYTRALRKSHIMRQRGQTRAQQRLHPMKIKSENQSRQCRLSSSDDHRKQVDTESEFSNENVTGYDFLFRKVLRASDVNSLGRIVLPKKDAERHFPFLVERDGIHLSFQDYHCGKFWTARYRFWPNNKSRMYLLENIGNFVNFHHLQEGNLLLCYRNHQGGGYVLRGEKVPPNAKIPDVRGLCSKGAHASPATDMKAVTTVVPATHQLVEGEIPCGTHKANLANSSSDSLNCTLGETGDASPTSEMKTFTAIMPVIHQLAEGEIPSGTHKANLANSSSDSLNCSQGKTGDASPTSEMKTFTAIMPVIHQLAEGEIPSGTHKANLANSSSDSLNCSQGKTGDAKYCQDGDRGYQDCLSQQSGNPPCSGDVRSDSPASYKPLVHDEDPYSGVAMLYVGNVKHRYLEETHFL